METTAIEAAYQQAVTEIVSIGLVHILALIGGFTIYLLAKRLIPLLLEWWQEHH